MENNKSDHKPDKPEDRKSENHKPEILEKINAGKIKMRPKYFFVLQTVLFIAAAVLVFIAAIFMVSFIFYADRMRPAEHYGAFLRIFPWILILAAALLTVALVFILKRYSFAYRWPLVYLPIAIIIIVIVASMVAEVYSFHERFEAYAEHRGLPGLAPLYRMYRRPASLNRPLNYFYRPEDF